MARKRKSKQEVAYNKQLRRIRAFIRGAEKRGYDFGSNAIPNRPKRITAASVRRLEKITPEKLYKKARYGGEASYGEIVSGQVGRKLEKKLSAQRAATTRKINKELRDTARIEEPHPFTPPTKIYEGVENLAAKVIISNFRGIVRQFNEAAQDLIFSWLDNLITSQGEEAVAEMLNKGAEAGLILTYKIVYSRSKILGFLAQMLDYLPEAGQLFKDQFMEAMEYEEDYDPVS